MGSVTTAAVLVEQVAELKRAGKKVVTTNGCFDLLHVGHVRFLKAARELGDVLIVGMNTDASVSKLKGEKRPIQNQDDRAEILSSLACVDYVCLFAEDTPVEFLKLIKPDFHAKGADYKPSDLAETPIVEAGGGTLKIIDLVPGRSTTNIVSRIGT